MNVSVSTVGYIRNSILVLCVAALAWLGAHCVFEENIFQLLPQTGDEAFRVTFLNIKLKDKIFVQAVPMEESQESGVKSQDDLAAVAYALYMAGKKPKEGIITLPEIHSTAWNHKHYTLK